MHAVNHKEITWNALIRDTQGTGRTMKTGALDLIRYANADSDDAPSCKSNPPQHFQNLSHTDNSEASIENALSFFQCAYDRACEYLRNGNDKEKLATGLYLLGRAFHCIQDFYAHSSWIFIDKKIGVWGYKTRRLNLNTAENELYLCYLTPRPDQNVIHIPWVLQDRRRAHSRSWLFTTKLNMLSRSDREEWRTEVLRAPVYHPDLHVDVSFSWASECYKKLFGSEKGYFKAKALATEHTGYIWNKFKNDIGPDGRRFLSEFDWNKLKWLFDVSGLRRRFDAVMGM